MTTYNIKELWQKACKYDNIPVNSKFVIFSKDNPFMAEYNQAVATLHKAIKP
jgi:hypothetical protein